MTDEELTKLWLKLLNAKSFDEVMRILREALK